MQTSQDGTGHPVLGRKHQTGHPDLTVQKEPDRQASPAVRSERRLVGIRIEQGFELGRVAHAQLEDPALAFRIGTDQRRLV